LETHPDLAAAFRRGWVPSEPHVDLVYDSLLDTFAVGGSPGDVREGVARLADAGVLNLVRELQGALPGRAHRPRDMPPRRLEACAVIRHFSS
jgi:hypothetical protein